MNLIDVFKISDDALGEVRGTYVELFANPDILTESPLENDLLSADKYPDVRVVDAEDKQLPVNPWNNDRIRRSKANPDNVRSIWAIRKEWITENSEQYGYAPILSEELAEIAEQYPSCELLSSARIVDGEYSVLRLRSRAIFYTTKEMCGDINESTKFVPVYLLSDAIAAIEVGMNKCIENAKKITNWIKIVQEQFGLIESDRERYDRILTHLKAQYESGEPFYVKKNAVSWYPDFRDEDGSNPYLKEYKTAQSEYNKLKGLILAAGMSSLL